MTPDLTPGACDYHSLFQNIYRRPPSAVSGAAVAAKIDKLVKSINRLKSEAGTNQRNGIVGVFREREPTNMVRVKVEQTCVVGIVLDLRT